MTRYYFVERDAAGAFLMQRGVDWDEIGPPAPPEPMAGNSIAPLSTPLDLREPTPTSILDGDTLEWVETATLDNARANAWAAVKIERDRAEAAPFEFEGGMYDPNKENIAGAALAALMAQLQGVPVLRRWTLADNTRRDLTGEQITALGLALTERVDAIHERGRQLRDLINAATTPAEAYGHTWNSFDA